MAEKSTPESARRAAGELLGKVTAPATISQYRITPNKSLGRFVLGMPIGLAIKQLSEQYTLFKEVNLVYSSATPLAVDIVLDVASEGIQLRFDPVSQRLKVFSMRHVLNSQLIDIYEPKKVSLSYMGAVLCKPGMAPTFKELYHKFGVSRGVYIPTRRLYVLEYPGLALWFPVPPEKEALYAKGEVTLTATSAFPDGTSPVASNVCIFYGTDHENPSLPPRAESALASGCWPHYFEDVLLTQNCELEFQSQKKKVRMGDGAQDVLSELGAPDEVFYKAEDKMRIHATKQPELPCADYFFNYFNLGVDLLFDAHKHVVKKFVLHTNFPGHFDFNRYYKCNFRIQVTGGGTLLGVPSGVTMIERSISGPRPVSLSASVVDTQPTPISLDDQLTSIDLNERPLSAQFYIHPDSKWDEIADALPLTMEPVPFTRPPAPNTVDPFGPTMLYLSNNIIFEVLPNSHIATVTVF